MRDEWSEQNVRALKLETSIFGARGREIGGDRTRSDIIAQAI